MTKTIYLATTNDRKVNEAKAAAALIDEEIIIKPVNIETRELQSDSAEEVALEKAKQAYSQIGKPVVVTDTFWSIPALHGFPGAYMKNISAWFSTDDWLALLSQHQDKTIFFSENIGYFDGEEFQFVSKSFEGRIVEPRGESDVSIENVAEFEGKTIAEAREKGDTSHDPKDYVWYEFLKWLVRTN